MGKRANKSMQDTPHKEAETVITFSPSTVDPILNPDRNRSKEGTKLPRPDDVENMVPLPGFMAAAIASKEPLKVTDDPEKAGTLIENSGIEEVNIITPPIQAAMNELNLSKAEKKQALAAANAQRLALDVEQARYLRQRRLRAISVPALPSGFAPYPTNESVKYAPYSVRDIEVINNEDIPLVDKYKVMLEGIFTEVISPRELTFADFTFIGDTRHLQALGNSHFKYPYVCKVCGKPGTYQFTLQEVEFTPLNCSLPVNVRFHSFPEEVFQFTPHTIGDVITLLETERYWRKIGEEFILHEDGRKSIDRLAINASRCISHPWEEAYYKLLVLSENPEDRSILDQVSSLLYHGTKPIEFRCVVPLDREKQRELAKKTGNLVNDLVSGNLSATSPNDEASSYPEWAKAAMGINAQSSDKKEVLCGAINELDVLAGDVLIPFRKRPINLEYGILSC